MGVPEIAQPVGLMERPAGRDGIVKQVVGVPPEIVGVTVVIAALYCKERLEFEKDIDVGAVAEVATVIVILPVVLPAELDAVTV